MKAFLLTLLLAGFLCTAAEAQFRIGGKTINTKKAIRAVGNVAQAATLTDADIAAMSREAVAWMDAHNPVDTGAYDARLKRLTQNLTEVDGLKLNFKVYNVVDVNAFACGDGSIRVFSSLMDILTDEELLAVIGHELGHVVHRDTKDAMKNAYLAAAARSAAGAVEGSTVAKLSDSQLGEVSQAFLSARFSQKQETEADDYGFEFAVKNGCPPESMANALTRLMELSEGGRSSISQRLFSSHPDTQKRVERMKQRAASYAAK